MAHQLMCTNVVVLDQPGYLPFSASDGAVLFEPLSKLHDRMKVLITTNLNFREWQLCSAMLRCPLHSVTG